jgi:hypothetical protein
VTNKDHKIPVTRLQLDQKSGILVVAPIKALFLCGPIPMKWLTKAAGLPGKTLNVAMALWWLKGMAKYQPFKLTRKSLDLFHLSRDAARDGVNRLEQSGLITVERRNGQRHTIKILI